MQEKNVSSEMLEGKVGRMYVPRQELGSIATRKMKVRAFSPNDGCYATAAACAVHICICMCCELGCIASKKKGVMVSFYSMTFSQLASAAGMLCA